MGSAPPAVREPGRELDPVLTDSVSRLVAFSELLLDTVVVCIGMEAVSGVVEPNPDDPFSAAVCRPLGTASIDGRGAFVRTTHHLSTRVPASSRSGTERSRPSLPSFTRWFLIV